MKIRLPNGKFLKVAQVKNPEVAYGKKSYKQVTDIIDHPALQRAVGGSMKQPAPPKAPKPPQQGIAQEYKAKPTPTIPTYKPQPPMAPWSEAYEFKPGKPMSPEIASRLKTDTALKSRYLRQVGKQ